jgi:hypothetical protein
MRYIIRNQILQIMKRIFIIPAILAVILSFAVTSCKKEKPLGETMLGKWEVEYVTEFTYKNNVLESEYKEYLSAGLIVLQLVSGGSGIYSHTTDDFLFSWTLDGSTLTITGLSLEAMVWDLKMDSDRLVWSFSGTNQSDPTITWEDFFTAKRIN